MKWMFGDELLNALPVAIGLFTPFLAARNISSAEN